MPWDGIRAGLLEVIEAFEEKELAFKAAPQGWPAGQIMIHIANAEEGWFRYVIAGELEEWPEYLNFENFPDKKAIIEALAEVHARTTAYLNDSRQDDLEKAINTPWGESISLSRIIWHVLEHEIHHRGELSLTLGMLGKAGLEV